MSMNRRQFLKLASVSTILGVGSAAAITSLRKGGLEASQTSPDPKQLKAKRCERRYGPDDRVRSILGPSGSYSFDTFQRSNLEGAITVEVMDGSTTPKTSLGQRAAVQQLGQMGVIDPRNPETAYEILQVFGNTQLWPGLNVHVRRARAEQDLWERWAATVQFMPLMDPTTMQPMNVPSAEMPGKPQPWHDPQIHKSEHIRWANSERVQALVAKRPELEGSLIAFVTAHDQQLAELMMQQQAAQQPNRQLKGRDGQGAGAGRDMERSNAESGNPADAAREVTR